MLIQLQLQYCFHITVENVQTADATPTALNLPFQTSTAINGRKFKLLVYTNCIQRLGNIMYNIFGDHLCRLHCCVYQRNDADRTYLRYCTVRAWIQLRHLEVRECDGYAV